MYNPGQEVRPPFVFETILKAPIDGVTTVSKAFGRIRTDDPVRRGSLLELPEHQNSDKPHHNEFSPSHL